MRPAAKDPNEILNFTLESRHSIVLLLALSRCNEELGETMGFKQTELPRKKAARSIAILLKYLFNGGDSSRSDSSSDSKGSNCPFNYWVRFVWVYSSFCLASDHSLPPASR